MLKLRSGVVVEADPLTVEIGGERRRAWADEGMVGRCEPGDEVILNTEALDLDLGSGGFDIVHVNLTRGLEGGGMPGEHVMKLNYTSLQHAVAPLEPSAQEVDDPATTESAVPVLVVPLHGHLAPAAWAAHQAAASGGGMRLGFIQAGGGALSGSLSRDVRDLSERGLVCGHITAGAAHGGEHEAITLPGAIDAAASRLGWDALIVGPGPGILGSASRLGHGGMAALEAAHAALALGRPTLLCPRLSSTDPRPRHRGLSHHSRTVLEMLLGAVRVPVPEAALEGWPLLEEAPEGGSHTAGLDELIAVCKGRHDLAVESIDLDGYAASGLPRTTMGRPISEDPLFFAAALASGGALAGARAASR